MKACRHSVLGIMKLCAGIFLSLLVVGFVASAAQAHDEMKMENIVGAIQPAAIVGDVVEGTPAWTVTYVGDDSDDKDGEDQEEEDAEGPVVIDDPILGDPTDPCYGCWDY